MIRYRLDFAKNYLEDAIKLFDIGRFNSSASRAEFIESLKNNSKR